MNIDKIVERFKKDTNNCGDFTYRIMYVNNKKLYIIYNEPLTSSDKISDFVIRSLDRINDKYTSEVDLVNVISNDISNFKSKKIKEYKEISYYLNYGFTVILVEGSKEALVLETKGNLARGIGNPLLENTLRGAMDSFVEDYQTNMGLIRRRIKDNNFWVESLELGRYTKTKCSILYINGVAKTKTVDVIKKMLEKIDIAGVVDSGVIKNLIKKENKSVFPTVYSTERPDLVCQSLLEGKIAILVDGSPFCLLFPTVFNDFFLSIEDSFSQSINISLTRVIRYMAFFISMTIPAIYIALTTFNQEMLPTELLINFAAQRDSVPFSAFFEALVMMVSFEILRESDLRIPSFTGSALSIVGALILGEAAVNAGIVSPIMIIVIAITSISALLFTEPEFINALRWYRFFFMIGAASLGIIGVGTVFIFFVIEMCSLDSFGVPYFTPFAPLDLPSIKNSIIKLPIRKLNKRPSYLSNNRTEFKEVKE